MSEEVELSFPVVSMLYELETTDPDYADKVERTVDDLKRVLLGNMAPYKTEGENTPVRLRVFTKRC